MSDVVEKAEYTLRCWSDWGFAEAYANDLVRELVAELKAARAENERLHSWDGVMSLLDEHYPESTFPTTDDREGRDVGPRIISLLRQVERLRAVTS